LTIADCDEIAQMGWQSSMFTAGMSPGGLIVNRQSAIVNC
jgi:hypothetical protein